jgi:NSS family neurotransmitter:Na+ symporter
MSFNVLSDFRFLINVDTDSDGIMDAKGTIFDNVDYLTSNIMLPLGGVFIVVFAGWVMCRNSTADELGGVSTSYKIWRFLARYLAPIGILFVFLKAVGVLDWIASLTALV